MDQERFQRLRALFEAASSEPPEQWRSFLAGRVGDDPDLIAEALEMLEMNASGDGSLIARVEQAGSREADAARAASHPAQIGPYRIIKVLGQGGMGTVYEAMQTEPVQRSVALKLINLGMDSDDLVQRFERERQALAMMQHDGIAKVHECGTTERGQPFLVMEMVAGVPLTDYCDKVRLPLAKRIRLMRQLCAAIQHAHQKGVVHRDLKPSNVLVSDKGGKLQVKVIDFGLAKSVKQALPGGHFQTQIGSWGGGTPSYMAPEQAGRSEDIDTRADIYSIGVMLYEVLVGSLPLPHELLMRDDGVDMFRILREVEPERPSVRFASRREHAVHIAELRRETPAALGKALKNDLDWVVLKALEKDRERRYESPAALAAELQRFLNDEPLLAGPPTTRYRFAKFSRRYRRQLMTAGLLLTTAMVAVVAVVVFAFAEARALDQFRQLEGVVLLRRLQAPPRMEAVATELPEQVPVMDEWLDDAAELIDRRPDFERGRQQQLAKAIDPSADRPTFDEDSQAFLYEELTSLLAGIDELVADERPAVRRRKAWLDRIHDASVQPRASTKSWGDARSAIGSSPVYSGLNITLADEDVIGLVPIGENTATGLWEFYHLRSASDGERDPALIRVPAHDKQGNITVNEDTGIVFVLLPGGETRMGAAKSGTHNIDPRADEDHEAPVNSVSLAPFLLARHELTRGQWLRLGGANVFDHTAPDFKDSGYSIDERYPAENMDWKGAKGLMARHGLCLPTEAQWEYGCRAGSEAPWAAPATLLPRVANLTFVAGQSPLIKRVGSLESNAFGLHDAHGNVRELCLDEEMFYKQEARPGDGLRKPREKKEQDLTASRGGSFSESVVGSRSSHRLFHNPTARNRNVGLRAVRALHPGRSGS